MFRSEKAKNYILSIISLVLAIILFCIGGEIVMRVWQKFQSHSGKTVKTILTIDNELGWLPSPNYFFDGNKIDASGKSYSVKIQINDQGFRIFGNPREKNKNKVLFLGDSYTHAMEVSNNKTYYGLLSNALPMEVFAFGGGGYGTLQEYMILDKYVDEIGPDIIVIQFCYNDFINNDYELELRSNKNNNGMRRPYLIRNQIIYKVPKRYADIRDEINKHSLFLYYLISRIDKIKAEHTSSVEEIIEEKGKTCPFFKESVDITEQILKKIKSRVPSTTRVYAFSIDDNQPYYDEFKKISEQSGIHFIDGIPQAIRAAQQKGITTRFEDGAHWNETGHKIAADVLQHYFEANL
jgi:lysophospholipase L1-like esterase